MAQTFSAVYTIPYSLFLDSARPEHPLNRHSYICFLPIETIEAKNGRITVTNREQQLSFQGDPFAVVRERLDVWGLNTETRDGLPPFQGGAAGYFGYDLARGIEALPQAAQDDPDMPDMAIGIYDQLIAFDHQKNQAWHLVHANSEEEAALKNARLVRLLEKNLPLPELVIGDSYWNATCPRERYKKKVQQVIDYIEAGDIFQANLSQRFEAELPATFDSYAHYCNLRKINPAPYGAYMNFGPVRIASASPERFLTVNGRKVETRPIKGTRPRVADTVMDRLYRNHLENSEKDRAENAMIVDLLRNDLSKVCEDHSIDVPRLCDVESFSHVHHMVSTITGTLRADQTALDLLKACFPGGSITGAPKIRAMEIIEELEPTRRGPYCGAMGYVGFNGAMDTAVIIRTLVYNRQKVSFQVGGGIVADSTPDGEYQETMDKAEALFASFEIGAGEEPARVGNDKNEEMVA